MEIIFNTSVWAAAVRVATPLLLAAFGCLLCAKAGITNLAIDGFITVGCFGGSQFVQWKRMAGNAGGDCGNCDLQHHIRTGRGQV